MNRIKKIVSALMAVAIASAFSASVLADKLTVTKQANYKVFTVPATITQGTTEFTVGLGVFDDTGATIDITASANAYANLFFTITDAALAEGIVVKDISSDVATVGEYAYFDPTGADPAFGSDVVFDKATVALDKNTPVLNITFAIDADAAEGTYKMTTTGAYDQFDMDDGAGNSTGVIPLGYDLDLVTVEAEDSGDDEVTADKAEGADYDTYTFENLEEGSVLAGKKVLMQKAAVSTEGMNAKTRFVVTNVTTGETKTFGSDIWSKLDVEGDGNIDVVQVIFGLVVDAANTDAFEFLVK